jgi:hypothetical protein
MSITSATALSVKLKPKEEMTRNNFRHVGFEVLTAVTMKNAVSSDIKQFIFSQTSLLQSSAG